MNFQNNFRSRNLLGRLRSGAGLSALALWAFSLGAAQVWAADIAVDEGATRSNVVLGAGDSLVNNGTIDNAAIPADPAVSAPGGALSIQNHATGYINATGQSAINVSGDLERFTNAGLINADGSRVVNIGGDLTDFLNTGRIWGPDQAVRILGSVANFDNQGNIEGGTGRAVRILGQTGSFRNSGEIMSVSEDAILLQHHVGSFENTGRIVSSGKSGVLMSRMVGTIANSGTIVGGNIGYALFAGERVSTFSNQGLIDGTRSMGGGVTLFDGVDVFTNTGTILGDGYGVYLNGAASGSFTNTGTIRSTSLSGVSALELTQFTNSGTIEGGTSSHAVNIVTSVANFSNAGTIRSQGDNSGVMFGGSADVATFTNSGDIDGGNRYGLEARGDILDFSNTGTLVGSRGGAMLEGGVTGTNSGTMRGTGVSSGLLISNRVDFTNLGTITGTEGISVQAVGNSFITNSGLIAADDPLTDDAIKFSYATSNDTLTLLTGSRIYGDVDFGGGGDTLDFSRFRGSTQLVVHGLDGETLVAGENLYVFDEAADLVSIYSPQPLLATMPDLNAELFRSLRATVMSQMDDATRMTSAPAPALGYAPSPLAIASGPSPTRRFWASSFGGISRTQQPANLSSLHGGLALGADMALGSQSRIGATAALARATTDVEFGPATQSQNLLAGLYGRNFWRDVTLDWQVFGGLGANASTRTFSGKAGIETATASYPSWFFAPSLAATLPIAETGGTKLGLRGQLGFLFGRAGAYSETGSNMNLSFGPQTTALIKTRLGLAASSAVANGPTGRVKLEAEAGLALQSNLGGSSTTIGVGSGPAPTAVVAGRTELGAYATLGLAAALSTQTDLSFTTDVNLASSGHFSGRATMGLKTQF